MLRALGEPLKLVDIVVSVRMEKKAVTVRDAALRETGGPMCDSRTPRILIVDDEAEVGRYMHDVPIARRLVSSRVVGECP